MLGQWFWFSLHQNHSECVRKYGQCGPNDVLSVFMEAFDEGTQMWCHDRRQGKGVHLFKRLNLYSVQDETLLLE